MVEYLSVSTLLDINSRIVGAIGINDMAGIEASVARPMSGFGDYEVFPDVWAKAAAYVHGFASTQYFMDGNKRTAWIAANVFLAGNGYELPEIPDIYSETFVQAVAQDVFATDEERELTLEKAAEWFRTAWETQRVGPAFDPRVEYAFLATEGGVDHSTFSVEGAGTIMLGIPEFPLQVHLVLLTRIHWLPQDLGKKHLVAAEVLAASGGKRVNNNRGEVETREAHRASHTHHRDQIIPFVIAVGLDPVFLEPGAHEVRMTIDGDVAACIPLEIQQLKTMKWDAPIPW